MRGWLAKRAAWLVFAIALVGLAYGAEGGPGWLAASGRAVVAVRLDRTAGSPLYDLLAGVAVRVPLGEPGFRLGLLAALLGALTLAGIVAAGRALVGSPLPGAIAAAIVVVAPPLREAMGRAEPGMLAAAGAVWAIAFAARKPAPHPGAAIAAVAVVVGAQPYVGVALAVAIAAQLRKAIPPLAIGAAGALFVVLWFDTVGSLPGFAPDLAATVSASSRAGLVVGAGLLGIAFGAATGLAHARDLALAALLAAVATIVGDHDPVALLALLALGIPIALAAIARVIAAPAPRGSIEEARRRDLVALGAGVPLAIAALALGGTLGLDDPGAAPARLAADQLDELPAGPGLELPTRAVDFAAIQHEQLVAGARPDLQLVPPASQTDVVVANALRDGNLVVGSDVAAFGRLDPLRAIPVGRGFVLRTAAEPAAPPPLPKPARYASAIGADAALRADLARATYEAAHGRLDRAARAVALVGAGPHARFGAADLAVLASTVVTTQRPPLYAFAPPPPTVADDIALFADDLAWVAALDPPKLPADAPLARRLHARWRADLAHQVDLTTDRDIAALGPQAVAATTDLTAALQRKTR